MSCSAPRHIFQAHRNPLLPLAIAFGFIFSGVHARGEDYVLIVGGGPNPTNNQVSLESNVLFAKRTLEQAAGGKRKLQIFFADGKVDKPDLQYRDPGLQHDPAVLWMTRLLGNVEAIDYRYRDHRVQPIDGPTRKAFLKQAFFELADELEQDDRLILYVTSHGGGAQGDVFFNEQLYDSEYADYYNHEELNEYDTTIALWGDDSLTVSELDGWLNRFSPDVPVVMIMAQCHSGGFAHAIFHSADQDQGLNPQVRAGFFSQRHDRAAAGCTPDIDESTYQEYSTFFWEAIGGTSRSGQVAESADYDGDGHVSFREAHAYAVVVSDTIDIPVTSSEAFLRRYSEIPAPREQEESTDRARGGLLGAFFGGRRADNNADPDDSVSQDVPLDREQTIADLMQLARPDQKVVIEQMSDETESDLQTTVEDVRRRATDLEQEIEGKEAVWATAAGLVSTQAQSVLDSVALQWPALNNYTFSPTVNELTGPKSADFVNYIQSQPQADAYLQAVERADTLFDELSEIQLREAKQRRLLRTLENVLLEKNLHRHAAEQQLRYFEKLTALEQQSFPVQSPQ